MDKIKQKSSESTVQVKSADILWSFPQLGKSVIAKSREEALKKLKAKK